MKDFITQSKQNYADLLIANGKPDRAKEVMHADLYTPFFIPREAHPESEPFVKAYNEMVTEAYHDIYTLYVDLRNAADRYELLMKTVKTRLDRIKKDLIYQKGIQEDVNILCNIYTDFDSVQPLGPEDFTGNFSVQDEVFCSYIESYNPVTYEIVSIEGNGYEGNEFVYDGKNFISNALDTSNRNFINDNNILTVYEYSRLTASNKEKEIFNLVNLDQVEARCCITLKGNSSINKVVLAVGSKDTRLTGFEVSDDGIAFDNILKKEIAVKDDGTKYKQQTDYMPDSGLFCFPNAKYIRITLESNGVTDETIAFNKVEYIPKGKTKGIRPTTSPEPIIFHNDNPNEKPDQTYIYNANTGEIEQVYFPYDPYRKEWEGDL